MLRSLNLEVVLPELILGGGSMVLLMLGIATRRERGELILWLAIILIVLAGIVLIRTFLSFSLEVEIEGRWPWRKAAMEQNKADALSSTDPVL